MAVLIGCGSPSRSAPSWLMPNKNKGCHESAALGHQLLGMQKAVGRVDKVLQGREDEEILIPLLKIYRR